MTNYDKKFENLREEILAKRASIQTSELNVTIGELLSMYDYDEINLDPSYQRLFRWKNQTKFDFIESLLLGYPIPNIFVMQRKDGVWDVIDGVQRISTIYQFAGVLEDTEPLSIEGVRVLKELENKTWEDLDKATKIDFRRTALPVVILKYESDPKAKYELFRRINTGSEELSAAEVRSAMILMFEPELFDKMEEYSKNEAFNKLIDISKNQKEKRFDYEIITRFIAYRNIEDLNNINSNTNIDILIDEIIEDGLNEQTFNFNSELELFKDFITFLSEYVDEAFGFTSYNKEKNKFEGMFQWFIFETIVFGLTKHNDFKSLKQDKDKIDYIVDIIRNLKTSSEYTSSNPRPASRIKQASQYGKEIFKFDD